MQEDDAILVTGATGMVGSRLLRTLRTRGYRNVLAPSRAEMDLDDRGSVDSWFQEHRPRYAFLIAARVGGIAANTADPTGFLESNLEIAVNQLRACHEAGVEKVLLLGSSCIYPRACPQPMREEHLLSGPLEPTNEGYAIAKIAALRLAQSYHRQYGLKCVLPMPCNIYGTGDHFDLDRCHVLSALVRRFCDAQASDAGEVTLWGSGIARREFIHVDDVVGGMLHLFDRINSPEIINLGTGVDVSIAELARMIAEEVGYEGETLWDTSRPDGMLRKCLDITRMEEAGFQASVSLREGIRRTIHEYRDSVNRNPTPQAA